MGTASRRTCGPSASACSSSSWASSRSAPARRTTSTPSSATLFRHPEIPPEIDDDAADLVQRWLRKDDQERWATSATESQIHSFFYDFSWTDLATRRVAPPVVFGEDRFSDQQPIDWNEERRLRARREPEPWDDQF